MALADRHSNAVQGIPQVGADFNIFDMHATQRYAVGTRIQRLDGNSYVYAQFIEDCVPGVLVGPDVSEGGEVAGVDNAVIAPASCVTVTDGTIGSKFVEMTNAGIVADEHAGGYFTVVAGTGVGYSYRIKGNTATGNPATGKVRIELYDKLQVALDATSDVHILGSKFAQLIKASGAAGENNLAVGVTVSSIDFSVAPYGWILVKGLAGAYVDGTILAGEAVTLTDNTGASIGWVQTASGGSTAVSDLVAERVIGQCVIPDASAGLATFQFNFE